MKNTSIVYDGKAKYGAKPISFSNSLLILFNLATTITQMARYPVTTKVLAIIEMVKCQCKTNCATQRCSCRKNHLICTELCLCDTDCENDEDCNIIKVMKMMKYSWSDLKIFGVKNNSH
jgi:hypothetical protein